jgi:hypothetical protein
MLELWGLFLCFLALAFVVGPALMPSSLGSPLMRVTVGLGASVVILYLGGFGIHALGWSAATHWLLLLTPVIALGWRGVQLAQLYADPLVRRACLGWLAVTAWLLAWQFTVFSYSGATWQSDWHEHYDRARFFVEHWDIHFRFLGVYSLASRPPLVNVVTGVFLALAGVKFHVFQAASVLLASLVFWPVCLLQVRFTRPGATLRIGWLVLLLMALPALVQNAAFTWTKLPTTFFILIGLALLADAAAPFRVRLMGWLSLTAGMLAHYSAGPWILAIAVAGLVRDPASWRRILTPQGLAIGLSCVLLFATWLGWALARLGVADTFGSNSTVVDGVGLSLDERVGNATANLYYTAVPVWFRHVDYSGYRAKDPLVHLRDEYFNAVQSSVPMIAGSLGVLVAAGLLWRGRRAWPEPDVRYWSTLLGLGLVLGVIVHTTVIVFGVAQICLVPFALLVTAWLAARVPDSRVARWVIAPGLIADFLLGIVLHFGVQSLWLVRDRHPGMEDAAIIKLFGHAARLNYEARQTIGGPFLHDLTGATTTTVLLFALAIALLGACFTLHPATRE